jgi:hypothetical protein
MHPLTKPAIFTAAMFPLQLSSACAMPMLQMSSVSLGQIRFAVFLVIEKCIV